MFRSIPPPPRPLFLALTLLTTAIYITSLTSKTLTGRATAWLRPFLTTRRRRNVALAFYIAIIALEFLQSEWVLDGDWGIQDMIQGAVKWAGEYYHFTSSGEGMGWAEWWRWVGAVWGLWRGC
ncbi:hypothetical protein BJX64DRAFT_294746 [Aspergillus heterothallicus]